MSSVTASKRYANGLLQVGLETGQLEAMRSDMQYIRDAVESEPMLQKILKSPIVKEDKKNAIVQEVLKGKVTDITLKLVDILAKKNRFGLLYTVATSFRDVYNLHAGILEITISTAYELEKSKSMIWSRLWRKLPARLSITLLKPTQTLLVESQSSTEILLLTDPYATN